MNKVIIANVSDSDCRLMSCLLMRAGYEPIIADNMEAITPSHSSVLVDFACYLLPTDFSEVSKLCAKTNAECAIFAPLKSSATRVLCCVLARYPFGTVFVA